MAIILILFTSVLSFNAISVLGCSSLLVHHKIEKCDCLGLMLTISHFLNTWSILELSVKKPCLHPVFGPPLSPPIPSFSGIRKIKTFLLNLSMKCWNLAFNTQGSRVIILVVQLQTVQIYVATMKALRKKERQDETQFTTKIDGFLSFTPPLNANVLFRKFFLNLTLCMTKLSVLVCFSSYTDNSIVSMSIFDTQMHISYHLVLDYCLFMSIPNVQIEKTLIPVPNSYVEMDIPTQHRVEVGTWKTVQNPDASRRWDRLTHLHIFQCMFENMARKREVLEGS